MTTKLLIAILMFCGSAIALQAQNPDSTQTPSFFTGQITATNNGISLIPSFSLGKPALLFDLSIGKGRLSVDPMIRFGMDGKPWTFVFWVRYKVWDHQKFKMSVGAHPSVVFRSVNTVSNGVSKDYLTAQRYFAWEATPTYYPHKNIGFGVNYLGSRGLTKDIIQSTTFLAFRAILPNISLSKQLSLSLTPQVFYLKLDKTEGTYASGMIAVSKKNFPLSISSILSKKLNSDIAGDDFVWNLQLNYNINNKYLKI